MAGGILKSFLISVAYEVDRSSEQRFASSVEKATLAVTAMGAALAASATAVVVGVEKMSERFERLYYAGQRTQSTVQHIQAMAFAVGQLGGSADDALSSFENFSRTIRENPQGRLGQLAQFGVQLKDSKGNLKSYIELYEEYAKQLKNRPYYQGLQLGGQFGISENTLRALQNDDYLKYLDQLIAKQKAAGLDPDSAARHAVQYMNTQRGLWTTVNAIYDTVFDHISTKLQKPMEDFDAWLQSHSGEITGFFNNLSDRISNALGHIWEIVKPYAKEFIDWITDKQTWAGLNAALDKLGRPETWKGFADAVHGLVADLKYMLSLIKAAVAALQGYFGGGDQGKQGQNYHDLYNPPTGTDERLPGGSGGTGLRRYGQRPGGGGHTIRDTTNYTGSNAEVLKKAAENLGTTPHDLAMVISYETAGTFNPHIHGGKGGNYQGLIQFGPPERRQFGANDKQSFAEQMPAVVSYLKTRGFKPGMKLIDLYSTINAGSPGHYNASDGNGTVATHVARMQAEHERNVQRFLNSGTTEKVSAAAAAVVHHMNLTTSLPQNPSRRGDHSVFGAPLKGMHPLGHSTTSSKVSNIHAPTTVHVDVSGASDPSTTAKAIGKHLQNQQGILVRQMHSAIA